MELNQEEIHILEGKKGKVLQKAMKSVVLYGEIFNAEKLVPIVGNPHFVTSFGVRMLTPVFNMLDEIIANNLKMPLPFTVNPRPIDEKNIKYTFFQKLLFKFIYSKQNFYEKQLHKIGLKDNNSFTCTCYLEEVGNIPKKGDIIAWAESSAVVFANSALGARTNRNSGGIDFLCNIIGKAPFFGLLTDEGRKADWLVEIKTSKAPDPHLLGSAIGLKVIEKVPYIIGLDKFLEKEKISYLKDMGASAASNGAVGLYHVENITPEALEQDRKLLKENYKTYIIDDNELMRVKESYPILWKNKASKPKICFIGCPHLTIYQTNWWLENIQKKRIKKIKFPVIMCLAPDVLEKFKKDKSSYDFMISKGISFTSICPLMYMNNPLCKKVETITNSNKLRTYSTARYYTSQEILEMF